MSKRVTIHDIAREAGVSAATVSYVINDTPGQSISAETKNKIWHVINMFNYKPNVFAKNLRASGNKLIAVCAETQSFLEKAEFSDVLESLSRSLSGSFDLIYTMRPYARISNADAIIAYNVSKETFYEIGDKNYIPLIAVNCLVEDKLFFQITPDYGKLRKKAEDKLGKEFIFAVTPPADSALKAQIENAFDSVAFVESAADLNKIGKKKIFTVNRAVAEILKDGGSDVFFEDIYFPVCEQTADCVHKALSREPFDIHSYKI